MKIFYAFLIGLLICQLSRAQITADKDTVKKKHIEIVPEYPGGEKAFQNYIARNLQYPGVANLIGIEGRVVVSFIIERDGTVTNVYPKQCVGAGCESEAVKVIAGSKKWKPGIQDGKPVRVMYAVPIDFHNPKNEVTLRELRNSDYGFVFNIKDTLYTLDEAKKIIGRSFSTKDVEIAEPFYNYNNIEKFNLPDKKEVYLLIFKKS
jgi:TonB family protein